MQRGPSTSLGMTGAFACSFWAMTSAARLAQIAPRPPRDQNLIAIVGGGPAGLRAAEIARATGARITIFDAQRSVGRKFLVAGRGGLNLTHGEPVENFPLRYRDEPERWRDLLGEFGPDALREWAEKLSVETYVGTSGRVFPRGQKAAALLRAWIDRLRKHGVTIETGHRIVGLTQESGAWRLEFSADDVARTVRAGAVVLALGGASWPDTGSDGRWPALLAPHGVEIAPWQPANCGWEVAWPNELLARAEGMPLKNLQVSAGDESVSGEMLITRYGLEGGALYRLGRTLRGMSEPRLQIDFKPQLSEEALRERAANLRSPAEHFRAWKLSSAAIALLETIGALDLTDTDALITAAKRFTLQLIKPRPMAEAISSAGGVRWRELDANLMLHKMPGVFVAGEMIDWEAPTGGYLLQGCFSTGTRAGRAAAAFASEAHPV
ncbi:MAG: TIGR03862 family flavoprotein [Verrucomicrobiota bacterium]|nr:TIGR03862 family flavoprotein [Verrucomicrobiota bacterium]